MRGDALLTVIDGPSLGERFCLERNQEYVLGRDLDCSVALSDDAQCSRQHAMVRHDGVGWRVVDLSSLNGTFVNDRRTDDARLIPGQRLRVGATCFRFEIEEATPANPPEAAVPTGPDEMGTLLRNESLSETGDLREAPVSSNGAAEDGRIAFQLASRLLTVPEPREVMGLSLQSLRERTGASVVGFYVIDDQEEWRRKQALPADSEYEMVLSRALTQAIRENRQAIWITRGRDRNEGSSNVSDALCAPLLHEGQLLGVLHASLMKGRFQPSHFDFLILVAKVAAAALASAQRQASLNWALRGQRGDIPQSEEILGESPPLRALRERIARCAPGVGPVLLLGPPGAGKTLAARVMHQKSRRAARPLITVRCAGKEQALVEGELFGHAQDSLNKPREARDGALLLADQGTLLLKDVDQLSHAAQARLLRALGGYGFQPLGSEELLRSDVRVLATSHRDLSAMVRQQAFSEELLACLGTHTVALPPLGDCGEDVGRLVDHFLERHRSAHGRGELALSEDARAKLLDYSWPGNVRQLQLVVERAVLEADGSTIRPEDIMLKGAPGPSLESLDMQHWERRLIEEALERTGGNAAESAKLLGIGRATFFRKVKEHGISRK